MYNDSVSYNMRKEERADMSDFAKREYVDGFGGMIHEV